MERVLHVGYIAVLLENVDNLAKHSILCISNFSHVLKDKEVSKLITFTTRVDHMAWMGMPA